ncbi:TPA: class I SAM-dependent methyltransferase [Clostridioides difficile]|uniref:Putative glycosyl transferase n=9 Tax=Clostridioides difficile TaxID=1496 RepID=J7RTR0_CLODI|nr:class I SAM-dependent methyltransferase [Clostridioides difficile]EQG74204.1 methyltransferase domain protein [Clostridioides difficile DA00165]AXU28891.1 type 12 methyltransferase [Clostridioides difficile]AXU32679.1 type 12 methyltransferase [Clostridioides difficile]AXU36467.1 type 12 methyltransferase [Clostridioides difficile]EAA0009149.1 class I SAM-dependent methyltransferase [Clostridioides difficile]
MEKYIGNIKLNFDFYKGNDLYSDGVVEDELLDIVKNYSEYEDIIKERKEWPIIYHLSKIRENIIEWIPINKTDNVLEVGSGCGAITGILSKKAKQVDCIELSQKRSYINAYRNKSKSNINIFVGNFEDIEKNMTEKYDYITLIGVFEYAESYINSKKPYIEFLRIVKKHLKKNGKIIIAIENRLGLKYWAGCKEDHLGTYFEGLEGYREDKGIKTFSKNELEDIFKLVGFYKYNFYYPYPDYKLPITIYSDEYLPKLGELNNNFRNFDLDRVVTFNETEVFDSIIKNNLFPIFSNSYLIILE